MLLVALVCAASGLSPFASRSKAQGAAAARTLSFDERVAYQRAVDEVYWRHTVWPKENSSAKPSFDALVTRAQTAAKVEETLRKSEALARRWGHPVSPEQLQAESARMARETRSPAVLRELYDALGNDAFVVAEVLARPALVDRLARNSFAGEKKAPNTKATFESWWAGAGAEFTAEAVPASDFGYRLAEINQAGADDTWSPTQSLPVGNGTAVWTGAEVIIWGGATSSGGRTDTGGRYNPATDIWTPTAMTGAPVARLGHTALWTGTEMLIWGGSIGTGSGPTNTGARYNPSTDTWTPTSIVNAPFRSAHLSVWTGSKMVVWGISAGAVNVYDLSTDSWKAGSNAGAPGTDVGYRAVWTGAEMFIWGGLNTVTGKRGGLYNPSTDTWRTPNHFNAPSNRGGFTMVWTGTEAIVWGGSEGNSVTLNTGGRYNPSTDTWTPTSTANAADSRFGHTAVWTGTEMVVYGGDSRPTGSPDHLVNTGGRYNPSTDSWTLTSTAGAPFKNNHVAVWTGTEMIVWGGRHFSLTIFTEAARYKPSTDSWIPVNGNAPPVSKDARGVWSGSQMLVWGKDSLCNSGCRSVAGRYDLATNSWRTMSVLDAPPGDAATTATPLWTGTEMIVAGRRYNPLTDTWTVMSTAGAPNINSEAAPVWTGKEMIVWGAFIDDNATLTPAGGRYDPSTDTWEPISLTGAPDARQMHSAVWTGTEMVVWGGMQFFGGSNLNTGGRYDPSTDTWRPTSTAGAPEARLFTSAVWTGTEMVVWGGFIYHADGTSYYVNTGGRYDPASDTWRPTSTSGAPEARTRHRAVWTGSVMVVWGGSVKVNWTDVGDPVSTGARYNPSTDIWTPTSLRAQPSRRDSHIQVWTGTQMIVFGGTGPSGSLPTDGAVYNAPGASASGNAAPSVSLSGPAGGAAFRSGDTVRLSADASDPDGAVTAVRFYANGALVGTATQSPFVFDWAEVRGGDYALVAAALDDAGGEGRSAEVNITVAPSTAPPVCTLDAPADNASYAHGASVRMDASATANRDRTVAKVEFLDNDSVVSTYTTPTGGATWGHTYLAPAPGTHALAARCTDDAGASTTSLVKTVTVADEGYSVSGQILDGRGFPVANVRVRLDGPAGTAPKFATTTVANNGNYFFTGLTAGETYTVTPEPGSWRFSPESVTYNAISSDKASQNFTATQAGFGISGHVRDAGGNPIFPATVNLSGSKTATTGVDVNGYYFFSNLAPGGTYNVQPFKNQFDFEPGARTYENLGAEQTADFVGTPQVTTYTVSGRVVNSEGVPLAGLRMRFDTIQGDVKYRATDAEGRYGFDNILPGQTCSVWPEDPTYTYNFSPNKRDYFSVSESHADADFVATPHTVTGRITEDGEGLAGVTVTLDGPQTATVTTGDDGAFAIRGVTLRGDYTVTAAKQGHALTPSQYAVKDLQDDVTANFASASLATPTPTPTPDSTPTPTPTPTPDSTPTPTPVPVVTPTPTATPTPTPVNIDDSSDFVAQHYRDFLGREADASGLSFWTNEIEKCGTGTGAAQCREVRRINVSAAFFLSIEFQETGYLVYRLQKATDGRAPLYADFMQQSREIGDQVVIGREGWEAALEANKRAFVERWAQTPAFRAAHDVMSDGEYVDSLFNNAGLGFGDALHGDLVAGLASGTETRATALRRVAEHESVRRAHLNRAFVTMQYFGYMRRDADDVGYNFWLKKLEDNGGNFVKAEMVKAFLSSDEYRNRFAR